MILLWPLLIAAVVGVILAHWALDERERRIKAERDAEANFEMAWRLHQTMPFPPWEKW